MTNGEIVADFGGGRQRTIPVTFPSNSQKKKDEQAARAAKPERQEKVITGEVVQRKKKFHHRFRESIISGATNEAIGDFIYEGIIVPNMKKTFVNISDMIFDGFKQVIERAIYGTSTPVRRFGDNYPQRNYSTPSTRIRTHIGPDYATVSQSRARRQIEDIILDTRTEAEDVLKRIDVLIGEYGIASVHDLYDLLGIPGSPIDRRWGWDNFRDADVRLVREGYLLILPPIIPIS